MNDDKQLTEITIKLKRLPAVIMGIFGVIISTILVFALVVYSNQIIQSIIDEVTDFRTLLIIAVSFTIAALTFIILAILIISVISIWGRLNKGLRIVLFILFATAIFFLLAAAAVGAVWLTLPR